MLKIIKNTDRIIICETCEGTGKVIYKTGHGNKWLPSDEVCRNCEGSGRLLEKTSITVEEYVESSKC